MNDLPREGEEIAFVEFGSTGRPFQVFTRSNGRPESMYDIEWCRRDGEYVMSSSGGGHPYLQDRGALWWAPADFDVSTVDVLVRGERGSRLTPEPGRRVPDDYVVPAPAPKKEWFPVTELADEVRVVDRMIYCGFCRDWLPVPEWENVLCRHASYCEKCGDWSTPESRCKHDRRKKDEA